MLSFALLSTVLLVILHLSQPLPNGAPESVCFTLMPFHGGGIPPQNDVSPFDIQTTASTVGQGQTLLVEIEGLTSELKFGGFMLQARSVTPPYAVVGRFNPTSDGLVKLINCNGQDNTITHVSPSGKSRISVEWEAPQDYLGPVVFNATVAQDYAHFWVGIESEPVQVVPRGAAPPTGGISTTRRPFSSTRPVYEPAPVQSKILSTDTIYDGCGTTKSCFGFPDNCLSARQCQVITTVTARGERFYFELKSGHMNPAYVAVGLSTDNRMMDDSIIECIPQGGVVNVYASWTTARPYSAIRQPGNHLRLLNSSFSDGVIYCNVERDAKSTVMGKQFDLLNNEYYLLLCSGSNIRDNSIAFHDIMFRPTSRSARLTDPTNFEAASVLLYRLHGAFMLVAWIGTASAGILIARYFKQTWVGSQMCGKDQWFAWHRVLMVSTWTLTMAGFIIIFVQVQGWSQAQNPHAILGLVTTIICFLQPIGAFFRPHPGSSNRPYFNWGHWFGGNAAHILAIVAIFFAVKLPRAELPEWMDWILVAFVAFHVFMHFVFSIAGCASDRSSGQRITAFPMTDMTPSRSSMGSERKQDAPYSRLRKILLGFYLTIITLFTIALVVISVLAPIETAVSEITTKISN
ncbi:putative ferric-chelate reductase 1 homolog isoform X2 [Phlebotomus argentipes]|uniref:putative ferric-chelate reductase 1 homolog isoform X2 n=1 Tax=Phlebotomus argentipes TaxID=94469 RepID=UPI002892E339|nr:putative ferric-chelate reductase 1 homolog isoform X2 [Phlebotomus argentipes]